MRLVRMVALKVNTELVHFRNYMVRVDGALLSAFTHECGVLQGSILFPFLLLPILDALLKYIESKGLGPSIRES